MILRKKMAWIIVAIGLVVGLAACVGGQQRFHEKRAMLANSVVLINAFEVPQGKEAEALASWQKARDFLQTQEGYISTRLHRNIDPNGKFHLINVARWRSAEDFHKATANMREALPNNRIDGVQFHAGLFTVIEDDSPFGRQGKHAEVK